MKHSTLIWIISLIATPLALQTASGSETVLIRETFADGNRTTLTRNPSTDVIESLAWWSNNWGKHNALTVANGALTITTQVNSGVPATSGKGARHAVAHFPAQTLQNGESLVLAFDARFVGIKPSSTAPFAFRFGLFNSAVPKGITYTADNQNPWNPAPGYVPRITFVRSVGKSQMDISVRPYASPPKAALLTSVQGTIQDSSLVLPALVENQTYHFELRITAPRDGESNVAIRVTIPDPGKELLNAETRFADSLAFRIFDTVGFNAYDDSGSHVGIDAAVLSDITLSRLQP